MRRKRKARQDEPTPNLSSLPPSPHLGPQRFFSRPQLNQPPNVCLQRIMMIMMETYQKNDLPNPPPPFPVNETSILCVWCFFSLLGTLIRQIFTRSVSHPSFPTPPRVVSPSLSLMLLVVVVVPRLVIRGSWHHPLLLLANKRNSGGKNRIPKEPIPEMMQCRVFILTKKKEWGQNFVAARSS